MPLRANQTQVPVLLESLSGSHGEEQHWAPGAPPPQGLYLSAIVLYYSISARLPFISYSTVTSYDGLFDV